MGLLSNLFSEEKREISALEKIADQVLSHENEMAALSDDQLKEKTEEYKKRLAEGETVDDLLPEAFATVIPVENEEEALEFIEKTKKKYWDARHNCFAYVIGERGQLQRCSDDGEPNGTAGKPMLDVLLGNELRNVAVVVTRYFGGTLLGTGGLVRASSNRGSCGSSGVAGL